jgi:hypothetical protein
MYLYIKGGQNRRLFDIFDNEFIDRHCRSLVDKSIIVGFSLPSLKLIMNVMVLMSFRYRIQLCDR